MLGGGLSGYNRFFTIEEMTKMTKISTTKITEDLKTGNLKGFKIADRWNVRGIHLESYIKEHLNLNEEPKLKVCSECYVAKTLDLFHKNEKGQYGVHAICRGCRKVKYVKSVKKDKKYCVYRFIDYNKNICYVGLTDDIKRRMQNYKIGKNKDIDFESIKTVEYQEFKSRIDMAIRELYYINLYKPIYNKRDKITGEMETKLEEKQWNKYVEVAVNG